jgi:hypothetical protein
VSQSGSANSWAKMAPKKGKNLEIFSSVADLVLRIRTAGSIHMFLDLPDPLVLNTIFQIISSNSFSILSLKNLGLQPDPVKSLDPDSESANLDTKL